MPVPREDGGRANEAGRGDGLRRDRDQRRRLPFLTGRLLSLLLPLGSRTLYSVETDELVDRSFGAEMTANVVEEGDKGGAGDATESDAAGNLYATNYEHNAVLRRRPDTEWRRSPTIRACSGRPRCRSHGRLPVRPANQLHRQARYHEGEISVGRSTRSSASGSARRSSCCVMAARPRSSQVELGSRLAVRRR